jgi:hypothetical protein
MDQGQIALAASIDMPRPRASDRRYDVEFVSICQHIRSTMSQRVGKAA